jgi:hypothetical protein
VLSFHHEKRQHLPVFALQLGVSGLHVSLHARCCCTR